MGQISLQIPQSGQPNSTEDPKVASDLTTIQTWANGNVDDTNLLSPLTGVRKVLLQTTGTFSGSLAQSVYFFAQGVPVAVGTGTVAPFAPDLWIADGGLSGNPQDFQVANKVAYARVRATALVNSVAPGVTVGVGLYQITGTGGTGNISLSGTPVASSTLNFPTMSAGNAYGVESAQFTLPTAGGLAYFLGAYTNGVTSANSVIGFTIQLVLYHA